MAILAKIGAVLGPFHLHYWRFSVLYELMSFAVIKTGGKQYQVAKGDVVKIEKLSGDHKEGDKVSFDQVLLTDDGKATKVGTPTVSGAKVEGTIKEIGRDKKISVIRFRAKSRYHKKRGHRQPFMKVEITKV